MKAHDGQLVLSVLSPTVCIVKRVGLQELTGGRVLRTHKLLGLAAAFSQLGGKVCMLLAHLQLNLGVLLCRFQTGGAELLGQLAADLANLPVLICEVASRLIGVSCCLVLDSASSLIHGGASFATVALAGLKIEVPYLVGGVGTVTDGVNSIPGRIGDLPTQSTVAVADVLGLDKFRQSVVVTTTVVVPIVGVESGTIRVRRK